MKQNFGRPGHRPIYLESSGTRKIKLALSDEAFGKVLPTKFKSDETHCEEL